MSSKPITIMYLIDTHVPPPGKPSVGGAEKQLYSLATTLDPERYRCFIVQLIAKNGTIVTTGNYGSARLLHFPTKRFYGLGGWWQIAQLVRLAKSERVDIIQTVFEKAEVMGWIVKRLADVPVWVTSRRDLGFKRKEIYKMIFKLAARDCDGCVAVCEAVKKDMVAQEGLPQEKITVIYNGLDSSLYQNGLNGGTLRRELEIDSDAPVIGMIADLNFEIKGHRYFLEAAKAVLKRVPKAEFVLAGDGHLQERYESMAQDLGIGRHVHFLGKRTDMPAIISSLTASVLCSTSEGLSNVILESMAAGRPVIATNVGGNPELVIDGVTGYVVPPADPNSLADALLNLISDPDRARVMGNAARVKAENGFTMEAMVERHDQLYQSLLSKEGVS